MEECHSRQLRPKTMLSYEHTLRMFSFWLTDVRRRDHFCSNGIPESHDIRNQLPKDIRAEQLSFEEHLNPDKTQKSGKKPKISKQTALAAACFDAIARVFNAPSGAADIGALKT